MSLLTEGRELKSDEDDVSNINGQLDASLLTEGRELKSSEMAWLACDNVAPH